MCACWRAIDISRISRYSRSHLVGVEVALGRQVADAQQELFLALLVAERKRIVELEDRDLLRQRHAPAELLEDLAVDRLHLLAQGLQIAFVRCHAVLDRAAEYIAEGMEVARRQGPGVRPPAARYAHRCKLAGQRCSIGRDRDPGNVVPHGASRVVPRCASGCTATSSLAPRSSTTSRPPASS